jgi:predicted GTPase
MINTELLIATFRVAIQEKIGELSDCLQNKTLTPIELANIQQRQYNLRDFSSILYKVLSELKASS